MTNLILDKFIYETAVYHGALKQWHILNLDSGTFYGTGYDSVEEAFRNIEEGAERGGKIVKAIGIFEVRQSVKRKTLAQKLPHEFTGCEYTDTEAFLYKDVEVVAEYDGRMTPWPGPHKNVMCWFRLANGKSVGFNENPSRGWSFPVINNLG